MDQVNSSNGVVFFAAGVFHLKLTKCGIWSWNSPEDTRADASFSMW